MNWLRTCVSHNSFFTAVDPADFYEWKVSGVLPKGSRFSKGMPPSDVFSKGFVVATASLPESSLQQIKDENGMFELTADTNAEVQFYVGAALSPSELLDKYHRLKKEFAIDLDHFRRTSISQQFIVNPNDNKVYRIAEKGDKAEIAEYETFPEIQKQLIQSRRAITNESQIKKWRSYELEKLRRFESTFVMLNNKHSIVDPASVAQIFAVANISPLKTTVQSWEEYFTKVSADAKSQYDRIQALDRMHWIKEAENIK